MTTIDSLAQRGRRGIRKDIEGIPGTLGRLESNGALTVPVSGVTNGVYVKLYDDPLNLVVAIDLVTSRKPGLGVRLHLNTSGNYEVTRLDTTIVSEFLGESAPSANIPPVQGSAVNVVWESHQFKPGRIRALNGSDLQVWMERLPYGDGHIGDVGGDTATAVGTITSGKKAWIVISNDPATNTLSFTKSTEYGLPVVMTRAIAEETAIPAGNVMVWAYLIRAGATYIPVQPQSPDTLYFVDLRPWITLPNATDTTAIHTDAAGEIDGLTEKTTPVDDDEIVIEDSEDSFNKKKVKFVNLPSGSGTDPDAVHVNAAGEIAGITQKVAPDAADKILIEDSADSDNKKYVELGDLSTAAQVFPARFAIGADELLVYNSSDTPLAITRSYQATQFYTNYIFQTSPNDGDYFTCSFLLAAGTYTCYMLGISAANRGKLDISLDGASQTTGQDWYSAGTTDNVIKSFTLTVLTDGYHVLNGTVNGQNGSSSNYYFALTKIWCTPSAD